MGSAASPEGRELRASGFRDAFERARWEAGAPSSTLRPPDVRVAFDYRIEKRSGRRKRDEARWNVLGGDGWELVAVDGSHAHFRRVRPLRAG